jgi:hypothetical protein
MNEEIKDPNQLDLFAGMFLTPDQEELKRKYIERCENALKLAESDNQRNAALLLENGFILNVDFVNTFKREKLTNEVTLGHSYNNTDFKVEATFMFYSGEIKLKGLTHREGNITESLFHVYFERDKMQCNSIQDQYRYIKPTTMLEKLKIHNSRQEALFEEYKKKVSLKETIIEKYTKLYPKATVTSKNDWSKYSGSFDIIEVKFDSGSYVQFRLDTYYNKEYLHKKHDAEYEKMNSEELLEKFSKQEALK